MEFTIKQLAETVVDMVNTGSRVVYQPLPVDDPKQRRPDITKARDILGWEPKVQLREGLAKTIDYFESQLGTVAKAAE
ncbi:UDP-glucose 4-epimerase [compost metagenome]